MRKCIRCNSTMVEGCGIKVKGVLYKPIRFVLKKQNFHT